MIKVQGQDLNIMLTKFKKEKKEIIRGLSEDLISQALTSSDNYQYYFGKNISIYYDIHKDKFRIYFENKVEYYANKLAGSLIKIINFRLDRFYLDSEDGQFVNVTDIVNEYDIIIENNITEDIIIDRISYINSLIIEGKNDKTAVTNLIISSELSNLDNNELSGLKLKNVNCIDGYLYKNYNYILNVETLIFTKQFLLDVVNKKLFIDFDAFIVMDANSVFYDVSMTEDINEVISVLESLSYLNRIKDSSDKTYSKLITLLKKANPLDVKNSEFNSLLEDEMELIR